MREKIVEAIRCEIHCGYEGQLLDVGDGADEILSLICEEIEKGGLTREEVWAAYGADETSGDVVGIAEAQLRKILALLRPIKNPVGNAEL